MTQTFQFTARDRSGQKLKGVLHANSETEVIQNLQQHGYTLTHCVVNSKETRLFESKIPLKELAVMWRQLGTFVRVGIPVIQGIKTIMQHVKHAKLKEILEQVIIDLSAGVSLIDAFEKHDRFFPPLLVKMFYAADAGGNLDQALIVLVDHLQKEYQVRKKVKRAFIYPAFILVFAVIMVHVLILFALPTFAGMYDKTNAPLPMITRILLQMEQFMNQYGVLATIGALIVGIALIKTITISKHRSTIDHLLLHLPIIGKVNNKVAVYRFSQTLRDLYISGVSIDRSMHIASEVVNNQFIMQGVTKAREQISNGVSIAQALQESGVFPHLFISMIHVGEETGDLESLLTDVAEYNRFELEQDMEQIISFIEPSLIIVVGLLVGIIMIGILLPMYDGMMYG